MTSAPNPTLSLTTIDGKSRSLDDWTTVFQQLWVVLPPKAESESFIGLAEKIFKTFGDSDVRCAYLVPAGEQVATKIMAKTKLKTQCFLDEDGSICKALGITTTPSLVHIRQDTSVAHIANGFDLGTWMQTCDDIAKAIRWTSPQLSDFKNLKPVAFPL